MNADEYRELERIFQSIIDQPPEQRPALLDQACGSDMALRSEVERLLSATETEMGGFMDVTAIDVADGMDDPPDRIGQYQINRLIASGGMGSVYEAVQENPRREVALKIMKGIASGPALRRFEYESQVLARLRHAGIAQIYEAGTHREGAANVPFFAMEYIPDAQRITDYAVAHQLGIRERLQLFTQVCDAVQHGHQKGIIHRDLKPANILVDRQGQVKVIDFGIARVTDADFALTRAQTSEGQLIGTLQYMSPEQVQADPNDVDVRSDVYALGLILYKLLCGRLPYEVRDVPLFETIRIIREQDATRPSTISRVVRGDVETIVLKALEKDRERRYQSADELGADIRHYLAGEPIAARAPSAIYQIRVFARRNRVAFVSIASVFVILAAASVFSTWQLVRADAARDDAVAARNEAELGRAAETRERKKAEAIRDLITNALIASDPNQGGDDGFLVTDAMDQAIKRLDAGELANQPETEAALLLTIARILNGNAQSDEALRLAQRALEINKRIHPGDHLEVSASMSSIGESLLDLGRTDEALAQFQAVLEMQQRLFPEDNAEVVATLNNVAQSLYALGRLEEALPVFESALAMARRLHDGDRRDVALSQNGLAACLHSMGRLEEALGEYQSAVAMLRRISDGADPDLAAGLNNVAACLRSLGRPAEALPTFEEALAMRHQLYDGDHPDVARSMNNLGACLQSLGRREEALAIYEAALEMALRLYEGDHPDVARNMNSVAECMLALGRAQDALPKYEAALEMNQRLFEGDHPSVAVALAGLAKCLNKLGRPEDALLKYESSLAMFQRVFGDDHPNVAVVMNNLGSCLESLGRSEEALKMHEAALAIRRRLFQGDHPQIAISLNNMADCLQSLDRLQEALPKFQEALAMYRRMIDGDHPQIAVTLNNIGVCLKDLGRYDEALVNLREARDMFRRVLPDDHPNILHPQLEIAKVLIATNRYAEAEKELLEAADVCDRSDSNRRQHWKSVMIQFTRLYNAWHVAEPEAGHDRQAEHWRSERQSHDATSQRENTQKWEHDVERCSSRQGLQRKVTSAHVDRLVC